MLRAGGNRFASLALVVLCSVVVLPCPASAQSVSATLVGLVVDPQGAPISGAIVTASSDETGLIREGRTSGNGGFTLTLLPPGHYRVDVTAPGFRTFVETAVSLDPGQVRRLNANLAVGRVQEQIRVVAPLLRVNTDTTSKGELVPDRLVQTLPLNGRNYLDLAALAPGVYHRVADDEQGEGLSASGARADSATVALDGVLNRSDRNGTAGLALPLDSVREFDLQTSSYRAELGRSGGIQVGVVTRSGGNRFTASLFDYIRDGALDARDRFAPPGGTPELKRQQWGGTAGGPIRRDRLFFFASYERLHERRTLSANSTAPNAAWLRGDFRNVRGAGPDGTWGNVDDTNRILDPFTKKEFPTPNVIPDSMIDPVARQILPFVPAANLTDALDAYAASGLLRDDRHLFVGRVDATWRSAAVLTGRWALQREESFDPFPSQRNFYPGFGRTNSSRLDSAALVSTTALGRGWLNEARLGYFGQSQDFAGERAGIDYLSRFGLPGSTADASLWGFPTIRIDGYADFGDRPNDPSTYTTRNLQVSDVVSRVFTRHSLKVGIDLVQSRYRELDVRGIRGDYRFRGRNTNTANTTSSGVRSFADFLLGLVDQTQRQVGAEPADLSGRQAAVFAQDDWQVRSSVTVTLGVRYERQTPLVDGSNRLANFIPDLGSVVVSGDPRYPRALVKTDTDNLAPRVGVAWRPSADGRTVVRGGAGIYFSLESFNVTRQQLAVSYPYVQREQYSRLGNDPRSLTFANPFPSDRALVQGIDTPLGMAVDYQTPEYYHYNLTVERAVGRDLTLELGYVGSQGRHLGRRYNLNQPIPVGLKSDGTLNTARPYPGFADIQFQDQTDSSSYNSLQASARRRMTGGLTLLMAYTFSRTIDDRSVSTGNLSNVSTSGSQKAPQDIYNMGAERGLADFQRAHQFSAAFAWDLPFGTGRRFLLSSPAVVNALVRDWQLSGIVTLLSGRPFTPQYSSGDFATQRPDLVSDPYAGVPAGLWFNPAAFARPVATAQQPDLWGNAGRNILIGPDYRNVDLAIARSFRVGGRAWVQVRAEVFNAFNRANYQLPGFLLNRSDVGRVTATAGHAREWQGAVRLTF